MCRYETQTSHLQIPKPDRMSGLDKSEFEMPPLRPELEQFVEFNKMEKNPVAALPDSVFLTRNYWQFKNTGHQLLIMKSDATKPKNIDTDAAHMSWPIDPKAMEQAFLDLAYQQHWSTRLVRAWAEVRRVQRTLAENAGVQNGTNKNK